MLAIRLSNVRLIAPDILDDAAPLDIGAAHSRPQPNSHIPVI
jgi:hypothetical protein